MPSKVSIDIISYWHYMRKYRDSQSIVGKQYVLDVELRRLLTEVTHPPIVKLLTAFIDKEAKAILPTPVSF